MQGDKVKFLNMGMSAIRKYFLLLFSLCLLIPGIRAANTTGSIIGTPTEKLYNKGFYHISRHQMDSAVICYSIIVERSKLPGATAKDMRFAVLALGNLSYIYSTHDFSKSYVYLDWAIQMGEKENMYKELPSLYLNMACLQASNGELRSPGKMDRKTVSFFTKAMDAAERAEQWTTVLNAFNNATNIAMGNGQRDIVAYFLRRYRRHGSRKVPLSAYTQLHAQGLEAFIGNNPRKAVALFNSMPATLASVNDSMRYVLLAYSETANVYLQTRNFKEAANQQLRTMRLAQSAGNETDVLMSVYHDLSRCYREMGDDGQARVFYDRYLRTRDTLFYRNRLLSVDQIQFDKEMRRMQDKVSALVYKRHYDHILIVVSMIFIAIVLLVLCLLVRSYIRQIRKNRILFHRNQVILQDYIAKKEAGTGSLSVKGNEYADTKYRTSRLDDAAKTEIMRKIMEVLEKDTDVICSDDFTVQQLSARIGWKSNYVSQVISEKMHSHFSTLLAEYRIREACRIMNDQKHTKLLTIEGIAQSVGYKSRSNFTLVFKRITGLSPSAYLRMIKERGEE